MTTRNLKRVLIFASFAIVSLCLLTQVSLAQSSDPDAPTQLTNGVIDGSNSSNLSDEKTYYYAFDVKKGILSLTLDITPLNKSDAGGFVQWTMMNTKFATLKSDVLTAQGSPGRQMKDLPVTVKRRIIMKIVVSGKMTYKFKLGGTAF
ncbi:MAG TPA: hypothetical protein VK612_06285 [Pyrinomonadaceae bacterium]|nr:hypothetical protein [Pyrinomonadaceae bacterium]